MQHLRIPSEVVSFYRQKAEQEKLMLCDAYSVALRWYLKSRRKTKHNYHFASSSNYKYGSLYVSTAAVNKAQVMAERDGVSVNSIVFSALITYYYNAQEVDDISTMSLFSPKEKQK